MPITLPSPYVTTDVSGLPDVAAAPDPGPAPAIGGGWEQFLGNSFARVGGVVRLPYTAGHGVCWALRPAAEAARDVAVGFRTTGADAFGWSILRLADDGTDGLHSLGVQFQWDNATTFNVNTYKIVTATGQGDPYGSIGFIPDGGGRPALNPAVPLDTIAYIADDPDTGHDVCGVVVTRVSDGAVVFQGEAVIAGLPKWAGRFGCGEKDAFEAAYQFRAYNLNSAPLAPVKLARAWSGGAVVVTAPAPTTGSAPIVGHWYRRAQPVAQLADVATADDLGPGAAQDDGSNVLTTVPPDDRPYFYIWKQTDASDAVAASVVVAPTNGDPINILGVGDSLTAAGGNGVKGFDVMLTALSRLFGGREVTGRNLGVSGSSVAVSWNPDWAGGGSSESWRLIDTYAQDGDILSLQLLTNDARVATPAGVWRSTAPENAGTAAEALAALFDYITGLGRNLITIVHRPPYGAEADYPARLESYFTLIDAACDGARFRKGDRAFYGLSAARFPEWYMGYPGSAPDFTGQAEGWPVDRIHLDDAGQDAMGRNWAEAVYYALTGIRPGSPTAGAAALLGMMG